MSRVVVSFLDHDLFFCIAFFSPRRVTCLVVNLRELGREAFVPGVRPFNEYHVVSVQFFAEFHPE